MTMTNGVWCLAHVYPFDSNKEEREEGGTPDILGSIRLGLAVQMKEALGYQAILVSTGVALGVGIFERRSEWRERRRSG